MVFDFGNFTSDALKSVDRLRSLAVPANSSLLLGDFAPNTIESRINTFYRAIGLPAIVSDASLMPNNNGNIHPIAMTEDRKRTFTLREQNFTAELDEEIVNDFLDDNNSKLSDAIKFTETASGQIPKRKRGSLFPMYVNGDLGIFPQEKRVAGAFLQDNELLIDNVRYERPLLEFITLLRLKGEGVQDTSLQQAINDDFGESLGEDFVDPTAINIFTFEIIRQLLSTILSVKDVVRKTIQMLGIIRTELRTIFDDKVANIPNEQPIVLSSSTAGSLEAFRQRQLSAQSSAESVLSLIEYDDTLSEGTSRTRNAKNAWLASSVLDMLTTESQVIAVSIDESEQKNEKMLRALKFQQRQMDLLLGTFSGLSGTDILVVITALFTISESDLLGLFNDDSYQRLRDIKGQGFSASRSSVGSAVTALENKVSEIYTKVDDIVDIRNVFESNSVQSRGA